MTLLSGVISLVVGVGFIHLLGTGTTKPMNGWDHAGVTLSISGCALICAAFVAFLWSQLP